MWACVYLLSCQIKHCLYWENYSAIIRPHIYISPAHKCCFSLVFSFYFSVMFGPHYIYFSSVEVSTFQKEINIHFNKCCIYCVLCLFFAHRKWKMYFGLNWKCCFCHLNNPFTQNFLSVWQSSIQSLSSYKKTHISSVSFYISLTERNTHTQSSLLSLPLPLYVIVILIRLSILYV